MRISGSGEKFELYILSLWFLFLLIIVITIDVPFCYGEDCKFIGLASLLQRNIISVIAFGFLAFGTLYYFRFDYRVAGSKSIAARIVKIEDVNYEHLTFLRMLRSTCCAAAASRNLHGTQRYLLKTT